MTRPKTNKPSVPSKKYGWGFYRKVPRKGATLGRSKFLNPMFWNNGSFRMTAEFIASVKGMDVPVGTEATIYRVKLGDWGLQIGFNAFYNGRRCRDSVMVTLEQAMLLRYAWQKRWMGWMSPERERSFLKAMRRTQTDEFTWEGKLYFIPTDVPDEWK